MVENAHLFSEEDGELKLRSLLSDMIEDEKEFIDTCSSLVILDKMKY